MTVSSGSFWTRTTASCLTSASSRYGRADIGTRCLSISVRRAGSTGTTTRLSVGCLVSVMPSASAHSGPLMPPSLRIRQKWTARKMAAISGNTMMWST